MNTPKFNFQLLSHKNIISFNNSFKNKNIDIRGVINQECESLHRIRE